jgi:hypothetical protein
MMGFVSSLGTAEAVLFRDDCVSYLWNPAFGPDFFFGLAGELAGGFMALQCGGWRAKLGCW